MATTHHKEPAMYRSSRSLGDVNVLGHTVRAVYWDDAPFTHKPGVTLYLTGPNGSVSGRGPKAWPLQERRRRRANAKGVYRTWTNGVTITMPTLTFRQAYRLRRLGALRLYRGLAALYRLPLRVTQ
jgi:hypothetical protein